MGLIETWKKYRPKRPPYFLDGDNLPNELICKDGWEKQINNQEFLDPTIKGKFQLGYLPAPFAGNLKKASIFILSLNPGFGSSDSYAEYHNRDFKNALLACLHQTNKAYFFPLDPKFSWTGSFDYWHRRFKQLIKAIQNQKEFKLKSYKSAREFLAKKLATIELVPYHSTNFQVSTDFIDNLRSAELVKKFVGGILLKKAKKKKVLIIVTRHVKDWGLKSIQGKIINYNKGESRGAYFNHKRRQAILKFLIKHHGKK